MKGRKWEKKNDLSKKIYICIWPFVTRMEYQRLNSSGDHYFYNTVFSPFISVPSPFCDVYLLKVLPQIIIRI